MNIPNDLHTGTHKTMLQSDTVDVKYRFTHSPHSSKPLRRQGCSFLQHLWTLKLNLIYFHWSESSLGRDDVLAVAKSSTTDA